MSIITEDMIESVAFDTAFTTRREPHEMVQLARVALHVAVQVVVRRCVKELDTHHDDFIGNHQSQAYFDLVDHVLSEVKSTLRELIPLQEEEVTATKCRT